MSVCEGVGGEKGYKNEGCEANDARLSPPSRWLAARAACQRAQV